MAEELAVLGAGVEEHPAPGRRGVLVRRGAFGVKREVFAVAKMSAPARRLLRKRLGAELDAVRDVIWKAELLPCRSGGVTGAAAPAGEDGGRVSAAGAEAPVEEEDGGSRAAKRTKASPFSKQGTGEPKRMRPDDRERLAGRLASLAAALPDHVVAFLQNSPAGGADSGGDGGGIEMGAVPMEGGALFHLKMLLDKFAPESTPKNQGQAPPVASGGKLATVQEEEEEEEGMEEEEEEGVDICRGVSRIAIRDIADEYGDLVEDMGIQLLSPLQRKYVDLAEQGEYVDICGDASPVVFAAKAGDSISSTTSSSSSSSSDSDSSSSDSDSDSSSSSDDSDSGSDPGRSVTSRSPPAILPMEKDDTEAQPQEAMHTAEPEGVQDQCAPPVLTTLRITTPAPEPAQETVQIAEKGEELQVHSAVQPVTTTSIPSVPAALPEDAQIAEPEELQHHQCVAPPATVHPSPGGAPPPAVLPEGNNGAPPLQLPEVAPAVAQVGEPPALQLEGAAPAPAPAPVPADDNTDPVAMAREAAERLWHLAKERAKAKARLVLLEMERAALPDERVYPRDLELLGIAAFEHVASTVQGRGARTAAQPQVNGGGGLRVSPGAPSILQQLGLFLKDDGAGDEDDEEPPPLPRPTGRFASHGEESEAEDGEIR